MPRFGSQIDTQGIPVKTLIPETGTAFPGTPVNYQIFTRTDLNQTYQYLGGSWIQLDNSGAAAVPSSRQIIAGTGLTGGGTLATDVTLSASFGLTSTTVMQGNTPLSSIAAPTADVSMASHKITNLTDPASAQDAATKNYVDNTAQGLDAKASVKAASTGNLTLSAPQTVDGISLVAGDRVLVKDQSTASQNGIYVVAAGAWTRATDADTWAELVSAFTFVEQGTANADSGWVCTVDQGGTLGTTSVTFVQFSGAGQITAGGGLTKTGNTLDVVGTANRIQVNADSIDISSAYVGQTSIVTLGTITTGTWNGTSIAVANGGTGATSSSAARSNLGAAGLFTSTPQSLTAGTPVTITHNLNQSDPIVSFYDASGPLVLDYTVSNANAISVTSAIAVTSMVCVVAG